MLYIIVFAMITSCTMFKKETDDELMNMGQMVLKRNEGLMIKIEPIQEPKR